MNDLISRAEAIELKPEFLNPNVNRETKEQTAIDRAYARGWNSCNTHWIKEIIEDLPSAQPERLTDYSFEESCTECPAYDTENHRCPRFNQVIRTALKDANLEPREERKAGTWKEFHGNKNMCICQSCGFMVNKSLLYDYTEKDPLVFKYCPSCGSYNGGAKTEKDVTRLLSLPTIEERKTGRWIDKKCSRCGCGSMLGLCIENFCPNCGADMRGEQDET